MIFLAILAGALLTFSFAPFHHSFIAFLSPAILAGLYRNRSLKQNFIYGWAFGIGFMGTGVSWVFISIHEFGHLPTWLSILITLIFIAFLALYFGLQGLFLNGCQQYSLRLTRFFKPNKPTEHSYRYYLILFPTSWTLFEYLRAHLLTGFPWILVAYSQIDSPLKGFIPILGQYGMSFLTIFIAGLCALIVEHIKLYYRTYDKKNILIGIGSAIIGLGIFVFSSVYLNQIKWTSPLGSPFSVALIQGNISQDEKWLAENAITILKTYYDLTQQNWDKNLIIWPEAAITIPAKNITDFIDGLSEQAKNENASLITGILTSKNNDFEFYNSLMMIGQNHGQYDKQHLVLFGEYIPFKHSIKNFINLEFLPFSLLETGSSQQGNLKFNQFQIAPFICYEIVIEEFLKARLPQANMIVLASNDAWFGHSFASYQHFQAAQFRALESGRFLLASTNTGFTAIVNSQGLVEKYAPEFQTAVVSGTVQAMQGYTPWSKLPEYFWLWLILLLSFI